MISDQHSMQALEDLQQGGNLPFCGRQRELAQLLQFWQQTPSSKGWRTMLIEGEAGSGKSTLLTRLAEMIEERGGICIRLNLGGELSSAGLMRELVHLPGLKGNHAPEATVDAVLTAFRRLLRMRPCLLVLDRAESITGDELQFLMLLLDQLREEACSLLLAGRSFIPRLRSLLSDLKVNDLQLGPLHATAIREIWKALFGTSPDDAVSELLHTHCVGHPGTLRLALRDLLKARAIVYDTGGRRFSLNSRSQNFERTLSASVQSQIELLLEELDDAQQEALQELASLGREFSRLAALRLLGESRSGMLAVLLARGVLRPADRLLQPLLPVAGEEQALAFTHGLLVCHLARRRSVSSEQLVHLLNGSVAVYHTTPWQLLLSRPATGIGAEALEAFHAASKRICVALERGPRNAEGVLICEALEALLHVNRQGLDSDLYHRLLGSTLVQKLYLLKTQAGSESFARLASRVLELVRNEEGMEFRQLELSALLQLNRHKLKQSTEELGELREEISALVEKHPQLRAEMPWLIYLGDQGLIAWGRYEYKLARWVDQQLRLTLVATSNQAFRDEALWRIGSTLVPLFDSPDELAERQEQFERICRLSRPEDAVLPGIRLHYHFILGQLSELFSTWEHAHELWKRRGFRRNIRVCGSWLLAAHFLAGDTVSEVEATWDLLCKSWCVTANEPRRIGQVQPLLIASLLTGASDWIHNFLQSETALLTPQTQWLLEVIALEQCKGDGKLLQELLPEVSGWQDCPPGDALLHEALHHWLKQEPEDCLRVLREVLLRPVIRLEHVLLVNSAGRLMQVAGLSEPLREEWQSALQTALAWCNEGHLGSVSQHLLGAFGDTLGKQLRDAMKQTELSLRRMNRLRGTLPSLRRDEDQRIELRMLGRFEIVLPDRPAIRPRGNRLRTLLALLVGNVMLRRPLERREFGQLASGEESADRARNILSIAVHRLREQLGQDAILTDGETPRLNEDVVRVDLLEAHNLLDKARSALRARELLRAKLALVQCLDLVGEETPFPGLYDTFFEALRDDFAARQRRLLLELVNSLAVEDPAGALGILEECALLARQDEDLNQLRKDLLLRLGQSAELARPQQSEED